MSENGNLFKVITLGDSGVGKTSILKRYALDTFKVLLHLIITFFL